MANEELSISITAPFQVGDHVAHLHLDDGRCVDVVLRRGQFRGSIDGTPRRLFLTHRPAPAGEAPLSPDAPDAPGSPRGRPVSAVSLYDIGVEVPANGRLEVQLVWACHCDSDPEVPEEGDARRFGGYEHTICATNIGKDAANEALVFNGWQADFNAETRFDVGGKKLTFGEITALAGDYYAHLDDQAAKEFAWAWPEMKGVWDWLAGDYRATTLAGDDADGTSAILASIDNEKDMEASAMKVAGGVAGDVVNPDYPMRRYLALASQNYCHFACQPLGYSSKGNPAFELYLAYHTRALAEAKAAGGSRDALRSALVVEAFGCHFLTDLFASGHIRTPRKVLGEQFGVVEGALSRSLEMHAEDNKLGLWCTHRASGTGERIVWRAYGDGALRKPEAKVHLDVVMEAVRRSVAEVFAAFCGTTAPADERAADLVPIPLPPGEVPGMNDVPPNGNGLSSAYTDLGPNHYPMYIVMTDGRVARRAKGRHSNQYTVLGGNTSNEQESVAIHVGG